MDLVEQDMPIIRMRIDAFFQCWGLGWTLHDNDASTRWKSAAENVNGTRRCRMRDYCQSRWTSKAYLLAFLTASAACLDTAVKFD